jgi:hypothetical protein
MRKTGIDAEDEIRAIFQLCCRVFSSFVYSFLQVKAFTNLHKAIAYE